MDYQAAQFAKPGGDDVPLRVQPRLASWMAAGHPDQVRLEEFLAHAYEQVEPRLAQVPGPLALSLEVGLPESTRLLEAYDLDNYLFPLAPMPPSPGDTGLWRAGSTVAASDYARAASDYARFPYPGSEPVRQVAVALRRAAEP